MHPPPDLDNAAIVALLRADRERGALVLFERFAPRLEKLLVKLLGPGPDVCERLNDALLRAIDRIDAVTDPDGLDRWLVAITVRVAREELRSRRRRRWLMLFGQANDYEAALPAATSTSFEDREGIQRVYAWVSSLSAEDRVLFVLRRFEGLELLEIAETTGQSLATVKRHLARLDDRFRRYCARQESLSSWIAEPARGPS